MKQLHLLAVFLFVASLVHGQSMSSDSSMIRSIFDEALIRGESYENLRELCKDVGNRLTGSPGADQAVFWGKKKLESYGFDSVYLQEVTVPHWERGTTETAWFTDSEGKTTKLHILALGGSIATKGILKTDLIVVKTFDELKKLGEENVKGKIVLFNRAMDPANINTFRSYGGCYDQRGYGAIEAAKLGASGVLVRSLSLKMDYFPHTGSMNYDTSIHKIPAAAVSTRDAVLLMQALKKGKVRVSMQLNCLNHSDKTSYNVIAEITGKKNPKEIIVVGGHLDSWDVGEGAHDDGAGIAHSIEAMRLFKAVNYEPNHTIRCILFMNEENGNRGGKTYAASVKEKNEIHVAALESDRGGFTPRGFSLDGSPRQVAQLQSFAPLFKPYDLHIFEKGYGGVDIGPLKNGSTALIGFIPDSQRYFDHHHAHSDVFEQVNKRELELGAAACASLLYLIDQHGIK